MPTGDLHQNEEMLAVLSQTSQFILANNLRVKKISPSITGVPLGKYSPENLRQHKDIHLNITLELEHLQASDSESVRSNLVASNVMQDYSLKDLPVHQIVWMPELEKYLQVKINENLRLAMQQSKAQLPDLEEQLQQFYSIFQKNLIEDFHTNLVLDVQFSNLIEASIFNNSKFAKTTLKSQLTTTQLTEEASRFQQSYLPLKINELLEDNRVQLIREIEENRQLTDISLADTNKFAFSRLLVHYDLMKSRILADVDRLLNQSLMEHHSKAPPMGIQQQEIVIQEFLNHLPNIKLEEITNDKDTGTPVENQVNLQRNKASLNGSVFLHQELKVYLSQMLHQNMQSSILR